MGSVVCLLILKSAIYKTTDVYFCFKSLYSLISHGQSDIWLHSVSFVFASYARYPKVDPYIQHISWTAYSRRASFQLLTTLWPLNTCTGKLPLVGLHKNSVVQ